MMTVKGQSWNFVEAGAREGWTIPEPYRHTVIAGNLWLCPWREIGKEKPLLLAFPRFDRAPAIASPGGLDWPRHQGAKLRLQVRNASPETDLRVYVATTAAPDKPVGPVDVPIRPYHADWQEVFAHLDDLNWDGALDRFWIAVPHGLAGDLFIREVRLEPGPARVRPARPDILGVLPQIHVPDLTQAHLAEAFAILQDAVVHDPLPVNGFSVPFLAPGADGAFYGNNWWVLDASLAMQPLLWTAPTFCERMMLEFAKLCEDNPDGCLQHEGKIARRGTPCAVSVIPRVFEGWAALARVSSDADVRQRLYRAMTRHLDWWLSPIKRDEVSGLVTGCFEESFTYHGGYGLGEMAAVDTNVAVAVGARLCADLAEELGLHSEADHHLASLESMAAAINRTLWNEEHGCYLNWLVKEDKHRPILASHMFDPLRFGIAPTDRRDRLYTRLFDSAQFGWGALGLTTVARQDPKFLVAVGPYDGKAWNGDIWTMRNHPVIQGLRECGEHERAADLAWHTLRIFAGQYAEYLEPDGGTPHGVARYAWTAGQWLQILFEEIFGLTYDGTQRMLKIDPIVPAELAGQDLALTGMRLPYQARTPFDIVVRRERDGQVTVAIATARAPTDHRLHVGGQTRTWTGGTSSFAGSMGH
jgi:hypothetical protein